MATDALTAATDKQSALQTALTKANDSFIHWGKDLLLAEGKVTGVTDAKKITDDNLKLAQDAVTKYETDLAALQKVKLAKQALFDDATAQSVAMAKVVSDITAKEGASSAAANPASWATLLGELQVLAKSAKDLYATFLVKLAVSQGDTGGVFEKYAGGKTCKADS